MTMRDLEIEEELAREKAAKALLDIEHEITSARRRMVRDRLRCAAELGRVGVSIGAHAARLAAAAGVLGAIEVMRREEPSR